MLKQRLMLSAVTIASLAGLAFSLPMPMGKGSRDPSRNFKAMAIIKDGDYVLLTKPPNKGWQFPRGTYEHDKDGGNYANTARRESHEETGNHTAEVRDSVPSKMIKQDDKEIHLHILDANMHAPLEHSNDSRARTQKWVHKDDVKAHLDPTRDELHEAWSWGKQYK